LTASSSQQRCIPFHAASLDALREKKQRTVYRLTLLKNFNMAEIEDYVALIARGQPDLIEIKGVTYCGTSPGSTLTMKDVPWHHEVKTFCETLAAKLDHTYGLAAEHAHSCCVLLAKKSFHIDGVWHTHINYSRFHELCRNYYDSNGEAKFTSMDYMAPTPSWAMYDAPESGFDPEEMRWRRNKDGSVAEIEYKTSESGCG
jgi:tRNA wybutosine-synthesizing protein 1